MRVILITTSFPVHKNLISGIFIQNLADALNSKVDLTVVTPDTNQQTELTLGKRNYKLVCFRYAPKTWQLLAHQPGGLPIAIKRCQPLLLLLPSLFVAMGITVFRLGKKADVFHANWSINGLIACIVGFLTNTPVITTLRGSDVQRAKKAIADGFILKICLEVCDQVSVVSDALRSYLVKKFPKATPKIVTIPNGVDKIFLELNSFSEQANESDFRFLMVGNLTSNKGCDVVIKAMQILLSSYKAKLHLIGNGPEYVSLKKLASELNIDTHVCFRGQITHSQIPREYENTDVFILSSYTEGRPNVVIEAMAAGIPVIASDIEGVRELIEDGTTGLLFKPGNFNQLAAKMNSLISDPVLRQQLGRNARKYVIRNRLTWEDTAKRFIKIYQNLTIRNKKKKRS